MIKMFVGRPLVYSRPFVWWKETSRTLLLLYNSGHWLISYIPKVFKSKHVVYTFVYTYFPGGVPREYSGLELAYSDALTIMYRTAKPVHV